MAMLAEKKRRTLWSSNPMGNDWVKDENKFGQRMLEKMGWEPGTGLGVRSQGRTEIVKMSVKNDTKGLGCGKEIDRDVWEKQIESFDSLLAELNGGSGRDEDQPLNLPSLEEKSKASRARVHYHKFTRGKDVSKYSAKDLNCILPILNKKKTDENSSPRSENNMYEYFKKKNKFSLTNEQDVAFTSDSQEPLNSDQNHCSGETEDLPSDKKKKKKEKRKKLEEFENEECMDNMIVKKKKKKKQKYSEEIIGCDSAIEADNNLDEAHESHYNENETNVILDENSTSSKKNKKKKKKKHSEQIDNENMDLS